MANQAPDPDLVDRFAAGFRALVPAPQRVGLAVSGGPDSLALLILAHAAMPGMVTAATVDHGLRAESRAEASFVAGICDSMGVPHATLEADVDTGAASLQQAARQARYYALSKWMDGLDLQLLATAHHVDDQAETLLMRLLRSSGVGGLAGVRSRAPLPLGKDGQQIVRPLLGWRKAELRTVVEQAGIDPVEDPSNADPAYDRSRIRARLAQADWIDPTALARSASALADADGALNWIVGELMRDRVRECGGRLVFAGEGLPRELKRRMLCSILTRFEPSASSRGSEVDRLLAALDRSETATLAGVKCSGGAEWSFSRAAPHRKNR